MSTLFTQAPPPEMQWAILFLVWMLIADGASVGYKKDGRRVTAYIMDWLSPILGFAGAFAFFVYIARLAEFL